MATKNRILSWISVAATSLLLCSAVHAQSPATEAVPAVDPLYIQVLSGACANCHGTEGRLAGAIPAIAGRPAGVLEAQLLSFKRGEQPHATVMTRHAKGYTDAELAALAAYFSSLDR